MPQTSVGVLVGLGLVCSVLVNPEFGHAQYLLHCGATPQPRFSWFLSENAVLDLHVIKLIVEQA